MEKISIDASTPNKMKFFEKLPDDDMKIEAVGNQSVRFTFPCGCNFVVHAYCGKPSVNKLDIENYNCLQADRQFFATVCKQHQE